MTIIHSFWKRTSSEEINDNHYLLRNNYCYPIKFLQVMQTGTRMEYDHFGASILHTFKEQIIHTFHFLIKYCISLNIVCC